MTDTTKNPNEPQRLNDADLADVTGGWGAVWTDEDEKNLRSEFIAANPNNLNPTNSDLELFLEAKGLREKVDDNLGYGTIVARIDSQTRSGA